MYKVTVAHDSYKPMTSIQFDNSVDAVHSFDRCVDSGDAETFAIYNLFEPNGKCHTKVFYRHALGKKKNGK